MTAAVPHNFAGLSPEYSNLENSQIVILPVAFDKTSSWMRGSRHGPRAIINASRFMELYDIETGSEVYKKGIHTAKSIRSMNSANLVKKVFRSVGRFLSEKKFVIVLGGEHSVSIGAIGAYRGYYPELSVLHLDAHADARDSYEDNRYNHACVIARVKEEIEEIVSVGIRSMDVSEIKNTRNILTVFADDIKPDGKWVDRVTSGLKKNVYVTIDLDVFDSAVMPSTGTPEPGGLDWNQVIDLLRRVSSGFQVVGFDVVELSPSGNKAPDFLAAKLIYKFLSFIFAR